MLPTNLHTITNTIILPLLNEFYKPHHNISLPPYIAGTNAYALMYFIFFLSLLPLHLIRRLCGKRRDAQVDSPIFATALHTTFALFCLLAALQTISQINYARVEFRTFAGKSGDEKNAAIAGEKLYSFIQYCRKILPGAHNARFLMDMDLSNDPGMITHRMLAYYLYPIDIRGVRSGPIDSLIIFAKKDAVAGVPDDFKIIGTFDPSSVIAVKKGAP